MQVTIKTPEEQAKMRTAGRLAAEVLDMIAEHVVPGVTTEELDRLCHDYIVNVQRSVPANLNRSEEHTSELQSRSDLVCRLLLEKKKQTKRAPPEDRHKPPRAPARRRD